MTQMVRIETIIATLEAMTHGTEDMLDQIALQAAIELLKDMDVLGVKIIEAGDEAQEDTEPVTEELN